MVLVILFFIATANLLAQSSVGLVGHWKFDEGTGLTAGDSSGSNHHGTLMMGPSWSPGRIGTALLFDGVGDFVEVEHSTGLSITDRITIGVWIRPDVPFEDVLAKTDYNVWRIILNERGTDNVKVVQKIGGTDVVTVSDDHVISAGQWTHIAWRYDGSRSQIFVNGLPSGPGKAASGTLHTTRRPLHIGHWEHNSDKRFFRGMIDDVRIYSRALSDGELQLLATSAGAPPADPPSEPTSDPTGTPTDPSGDPTVTQNNPPSAQDQSITALQNTPVGITLRATDPDGDPLSYRIVASPQNGVLSGSPPNVAYTSVFSGGDSFTFEARDGDGAADIGRVNITIQAASTGGTVDPSLSGDYCGMANIRCAHLFQGSDAGRQIQSAIDDLVRSSPHGGTVDARGVTNTVLSAVTVRPGIALLLPALDFTQTGTLTVNEYGSVLGRPNSQGKFSSTRLSPTGISRSIRVVHSQGPGDRNWVGGGMLAYLRVQADNMASGTSCVEIDQVSENWYMGFIHLQSCKSAGILSGGGAASYPRNWAGANKLGPLAIMGTGGCAVHFDNMAAEVRIDGLSGDDNKKMICVTNSRFNGFSLVVENFKSETFTRGSNNPVIEIDNAGAVDNILISGGRHTCGAGGCQDFIRITNTQPNEGPYITVMAEYVQGYQNFLNDVANGVTIPNTTDNLGKINQFVYSGVKGDLNVRSWVARGLFRVHDSSSRPAPCTADIAGSMYFSRRDSRLCVCANDGLSYTWLKSDDYSRSTGQCSQ